MKIPTESMMCIALIKPSSKLAYEWSLQKPSYAIYEYSKAYGTHEIRFGDGTWQKLNRKQMNDLVLLPQLDVNFIDKLFV